MPVFESPTETPGVRVHEFRCPGEKRPFVAEHAGDDTDEPRDIVLELPMRGAHLRALGRPTFVVDVTTVAVLRADDTYRRASPSAAPQTSTWLTVSGELAERLERARLRVLPLSPASARAHQQLRAATSALELHERAIELVDAIAETSGEPPAIGARPASAAWIRLAAELQYAVATRYAEDLSLVELARGCRVSPSHAARVFRAVTGRSIHHQLVRVRLHHALHELSGGAGALTAVALRAGFSSHSHFTSAFRRVLGIAPSALTTVARASRRRRAG